MFTDKLSLQASLERSLERHRVPGASIAVFHEGEVTAASAGVANVNTGVELTTDTVMHIGSITKLLTATLVMQLVDEGRVDLDERVLRYLPDLVLGDRAALEQITVRMLLNHTSGIDGEMLPDHGPDEETIEKGIARFALLGQKYRPGTEFSYCNAGTVIAGYLTQRLSGVSWYRLVRERIFEPLHLEHAVTLPEEALLHRASVGHYLSPPPDQKLVRTSKAFLPLSFSPGGVTPMTSARDLIEFARAHMAKGVGTNGARILSERSARIMQQKTVNNEGKGYTCDLDMAIGWMVVDGGLLTHSGGGPGIVSALYVHPQREWAAAILTNASHGLNLINEFMEPWLKEVGPAKPMGVADIQLPSEPVAIDSNKYIGVYEDVLVRFRIGRAPEGLLLSRQWKFGTYENNSTQETQPARLIALGDEKFLWESKDEDRNRSSDAFRVFTFRNADAAGHMQHLGWSARLYPRVF